jgi:rhamnosyltransferase
MREIFCENNICAGIVLYNPNEKRLTENIESILPQVSMLILVDNSSINTESILNIWRQDSKIKIIKNIKNEGIAKALNQMCEKASVENYEWILTLDQDSVCPGNLIEKFLKFTEYSDIGIICPRFELNINGHLLKKMTKNFDYVDYCITSASLTNLEAWNKSGKFDEWMFIDCVDYDFCLKLKNSGYKIIRVNNIIISHEVGNPQIKKLLFGWEIVLHNHNPLRNYYISRNTVYILKKYWRNKSVYKWVPRLFYWQICKLIFEKNKKQTFVSFINGCRVGLLCKINNNKIS